MSEKILVTSALPYANGPIHLGHLAGAYLPADIFVRYQRLLGNDVVYICGSDEHGVPIMLRARAEGVEPQVVVDRFHKDIKESFEKFGISFDYYGRTSSEMHHKTSQDFFNTLAEKEGFVLKKEKQLYDAEAGMFLADRFVRGTCPKCSYEDAYGDQCEQCGSTLSPKDLINPRSAITDAKPIEKETTHWYLPLEKHQHFLEKWIAGHPEWKPNALGQIKSWFSDGLRDRAVTRDLPWGVPVPEKAAQLAEAEASGKVLYVWFDAPIGYISATREWAEQQNKPELWKQYWQKEDTRLVHFIGKDNIVFHSIIFPAMLHAHGDYVLPDNVPANEFLNLEGGKLSTSRNYAVWLNNYLKNFEPDSLRYCLTAIMPETKDADFSWKDFQGRHNNELADILGNFVNRSAIFCQKYYQGTLPELGPLGDLDKQLIELIKTTTEKAGAYINKYQFKNYLNEVMNLARFANKYFNDKEPWKARKENQEECATTVHLCNQTIYALSVLFDPVIPHKTEKMRMLLNWEKPFNWNDATTMPLPVGHKINKPEILFSKIEDAPIEAEIEKLNGSNQVEEMAANLPEFKEQIAFDDFEKLDFRVAKVLEVQKVPKTSRLLQFKMDLGTEQRTIISGIAEQYSAEELLGKNLIVIANLKPIKIRGIESHGMILTAENEDFLSLLTTLKEIAPGSAIS